MFDHMIFGAGLAAILVLILALLKLAIEYPGCFSWCMRSVHRKTEKHSGEEMSHRGHHEDSLDPEDLHLSVSKLSALLTSTNVAKRYIGGRSLLKLSISWLQNSRTF